MGGIVTPNMQPGKAAKWGTLLRELGETLYKMNGNLIVILIDAGLNRVKLIITKKIYLSFYK